MADKDCFVISPIGDEDSEIRKRSDQVLKHVIKPAVTECGYNTIRADQISEPGMITSQVIQHIVDDPLVVADLTGRNPNVFYELAIRHVTRKPLVQLIEKHEQIPFDVMGTRTIQIDHRNLDSVENGRREIIRQVKSLESKASDIENPISVALDLQILRQVQNPEYCEEVILEVTLACHRWKNSYMDLYPGHFANVKGNFTDIWDKLMSGCHVETREEWSRYQSLFQQQIEGVVDSLEQILACHSEALPVDLKMLMLRTIRQLHVEGRVYELGPKYASIKSRVSGVLHALSNLARAAESQTSASPVVLFRE